MSAHPGLLTLLSCPPLPGQPLTHPWNRESQNSELTAPPGTQHTPRVIQEPVSWVTPVPFSFVLQPLLPGARDLPSVWICVWSSRNDITQHEVTTCISFSRRGIAGLHQHRFPTGGDSSSGRFPGGPPRAGRTADEPWHCSLTPQEQQRESSPCRAFHLLPGPVWPEDRKSFPGFVPFITTLYC